jgi:nitroreductase
VDEQLALRVAELAGQAPSVHDTQPWRFVATATALDLYADRSRQLLVLDPTGRQLTISCGTALGLARLAVRATGHSCSVELLPDAGDPDHLARVTIGAPVPAPADELVLAREIGRRRTVRDDLDAVPLAPAARVALDRGAAAEGASLHWLDVSEHRVGLAVLTDRAQRIEQADAAVRAELARWQRPGGADPQRLAPPAEHPDLAVLSTRYDGPTSWLQAGQALARVLLRTTELGLAALPLGHVLDLPWTRQRLRLELALSEHPQLVLLLGHACPPGTRSPRRPVTDVVETRA